MTKLEQVMHSLMKSIALRTESHVLLRKLERRHRGLQTIVDLEGDELTDIGLSFELTCLCRVGMHARFVLTWRE